MVFTVNGVDMIPYIALEGLEYQRQDLDGPTAGRAMDGTMYRDRITTKFRFDVTCRPLTAEEAAIVLSAIYPEYVSVTYTDPMTNSVKSSTAYSNNVPAQYLMNINGKEYWGGITFPIIER